MVRIYSPNFYSGNNITELVTGSGTNYFEITKSGLSAQSNKALGSGYLKTDGIGT